MKASTGSSFNSDYYLAVATTMPILIVTLVIQTRSLGGRDVQYVLRGVRLMSKNIFAALLNPLNWIIVGPLLFAPAACFVAEGLSLVALHERRVAGLQDLIITMSIVLAFGGIFFAGMLLVFREAEDGEQSTNRRQRESLQHAHKLADDGFEHARGLADLDDLRKLFDEAAVTLNDAVDASVAVRVAPPVLSCSHERLPKPAQ